MSIPHLVIGFPDPCRPILSTGLEFSTHQPAWLLYSGVYQPHYVVGTSLVFDKGIPDWAEFHALQADMRVATCNDKVGKIMSDTGELLYKKSIRSEKENFGDEECAFRFAERLNGRMYPIIGHIS